MYYDPEPFRSRYDLTFVPLSIGGANDRTQKVLNVLQTWVTVFIWETLIYPITRYVTNEYLWNVLYSYKRSWTTVK
jgi:hypothetical protein